MTQKDIENLFLVGQSEKKYGHSFKSTRSAENRFYQGSKGIGFLSAMHFGDHVTWTSTTEKGPTLQIECDKKYLEKQKDVKEAKLPLRVLSQQQERGTSITIALDDYNAKTIKECFENPVDLSKIGNVFHKSKIKINIYKDGEQLQFEHVNDFVDKIETNIFYVTISSKNRKVIIHNGKKKAGEFSVSYDKKLFKIDGEISILKLGSGHNVSNTSRLFINDNGSLTPLIFINDNLHEEYRLFDPEIMRKISGKQTLAQMIGFIDITCSNKELTFTPDRSRLSRNNLSDSIKEVLRHINMQIQIIASEYKQIHEKDDDFYVGFKPKRKNPSIAYMQLTKRLKYIVPSKQIKLSDLILYSADSGGRAMQLDKIKIYVNNKLSSSGVLPSQVSPRKITIRFEYNDPHTKLAVEECELEFCDKNSLINSLPRQNLMDFQIDSPNGGYMSVCARLQKEINELYVKYNDKYLKTIACSLRAVFELASAQMYNNADAPAAMQSITETDKMADAFDQYFQDNKNKEFLSKHTSITYKNMKNIDSSAFKARYTNSHLGAHKSDAYVDICDIKAIAKKASLYAYLMNAILSK